MMIVKASIIDYPRKSLDPKLFNEAGHMNQSTREFILDVVDGFLDRFDLPITALSDVLIYGSILTNQWNSRTDVDGRIVLDKQIMHRMYPEATGDDLFDVAQEDIHGVLIDDTRHPLNLTVVIEGESTYLGQAPLGGTEYDPVYSVLHDQYLNPSVESDVNPDEQFSEEKEQTRQIMKQLDDLIRETRIDVVDYETLEDAVKDVKHPDGLIKQLRAKLKEIEDDLGQIAQEYEDVRDRRSEALSSDPRADWKRSRHWAPGNVQYKYLERYKYIDLLKKLTRIFKGGVQEDEVEEVEKVLHLDGQYMEDIDAPTEINMNEVVRSCPWCGYASSKPPQYIDGKACPKCGFINQPSYGGEYSAWVFAFLKKAGFSPDDVKRILE